MLSMKLLLAFGLLTGIFVDQCDLGDFNIEEFTDKVAVTNISSGADAFVGVKFDRGQVNMDILAGKSRTAIAIASTKYTVKVVGHTSGDLDHYRDRLLELRSRLQDLTLSSKASPDEVLTAGTELLLLKSALEQMQDSTSVQSCTGSLVYGVTSQVTVNWTTSADGTGFWVLNCG